MNSHEGREMKNSEVRFEGNKYDLIEFREELLKQIQENYEVGDIKEASPDPLNRPKQGMEPLTYFIIVFSAHLSVEIVKATIKVLIEKAKKKKIDTEIR